MKNAPMKHIADQLATHGRYGDTMLVHMNPHEVAGIASLAPGGRLTINPVTGQPEAFLPFLAPLLGGWLGSAAAGAGLLGSLGTVAGSAIGSGLATTLATGDLEQGLISGLTGFGLGSALSGLGSAAGTAGTAGTVGTTASAIPDAVANEVLTQAGQAAGTGAAQSAVGAVPTGIQTLSGAGNVAGVPVDFSKVAGASQFTGGNPMAQMGLDVDSIVSSGATPGKFANLAQTATSPPNTFTNNLMAPFRQPEQFIKNLTKPSSFLPMYIGEGTNATTRAMQMNEAAGRRFKEEQEAEGSMARQGILRALERVRTDYGMFAGGQVDYAGGGQVGNSEMNYAQGMKGGGSLRGSLSDDDISRLKELKSSGNEGAAFAAVMAKNMGAPSDNPFFKKLGLFGDDDSSQSIDELYGRYGSAAGLQSSLRGPVLNTPPAFDYNALYSGGSGYAPGIAPEFMFFSQRAPDAGGGTGGGGTGGGGTGGGGTGGGFDSGSFDGGFRDDIINRRVYNYLSGGYDSLSGGVNPDYYLGRNKIQLFAEGGPVEPTMAGLDMVEGEAPAAPDNPFRGEYDGLVQSTISAIKGEIENPEPVINKFVEEYGPEAFMQLREQVLQGIQPGAQTEGLVDGPGGGMDDLVQGSIADGRPVAVSPGEYIIPADVVSAAGDGHTGGGAEFFDNLIESIRVKKNGRPEQPKSMKEIVARDIMG